MLDRLSLLLVAFLPLVFGQTWCGKHYKKGSTVTDPGGRFQEPATSSSQLLNFRCWPRVQPYLAGESSGQIIIDAGLTNLKISGTQAFKGGSGSLGVSVTATVNGGTVRLAAATMALNSTGKTIPFDPSILPASTTPWDVTCTATLGSDTYTTTTKISKLPLPSGGGGVTKQDYLTGALLVPADPTKLAGTYNPILPFGFYTGFDDYLSKDPVNIIANVKNSGRNMVHVVPPFLDLPDVFQTVLDEIKKQGLYLMFDMRDDYQNLTNVKNLVNEFKNYPNLLLWYTADEPDGWAFPQDSTLKAGNQITALDPYHPVSLVLNCFDYYFEPYTQGASIIMHDPYPIGINAQHSTVWDTACNSTYGDCGCDGCKGNFGDLTERADVFAHRLSVDGRSRGISSWSIPQAFGIETYWPREPTPTEFILQTVITLNHRSLGIVPWTEDHTMPSDLKASASVLGSALPTITSFLLSDSVAFKAISRGDPTGVDIASWTLGKQTLVLAGNMGNGSVSKTFSGGLGAGATLKSILAIGGGKGVISSSGDITVSFGALGSVGLVITSA